ncbi:hypothetical protein HN592_00660 [Candidatus Woesearchaeota archaeon]|jgi:hypothetical protein|nr:hypothetical protein [Candidatus Woesearchaeota archaeon]MBT4368815.1 hypothetical protein [Candidatus Woesearchaeota archaeon]MBT4712104.1 hypothetical protein [Candidatus Woesearchaeota archaeon]MBT6639148.1 hypothetical protein [Candidatus Woesearchaeota archaeon]MBT7134348.1 hypothetical protein [Candidatus Woesearchaeota archaeon]
MKKLTSFLIVLLFCFSLVSAFTFENGQTSVPVQLQNGWNLLYGVLDVETQLASDIANVRVVYAFIPETQEYARVYPNPEVNTLTLIDDDKLANMAVWVYLENYDQSYSNLIIPENSYIEWNARELSPGWNFVGISPEILGKETNEITGNCDLLKIARWDTNDQQWRVATYAEVSNTNIINTQAGLGTGILFKVSSECVLSTQ